MIKRILICLIFALFHAAYAAPAADPLGLEKRKACFYDRIRGIALSICTHTYEDYGKMQRYLSKLFEKNALKEYQAAQKKQGYAHMLRTNKYAVLCSALRPPKILNRTEQMIDETKYIITRVAIPVRISFIKEFENPRVEEKEYIFDMYRKNNSASYGRVGKFSSRPWLKVASQEKDAPMPIQYDPLPGPICDISVTSSRIRPLHSELDVRLWIDEALANAYMSDQGSRYFTPEAWKKFIGMHRSISNKAETSLNGIFDYRIGVLPALIKSRGLKDEVYQWNIIKWYDINDGNRDVDMKLSIMVVRAKKGKGIRGLVIRDLSFTQSLAIRTDRIT